MTSGEVGMTSADKHHLHVYVSRAPAAPLAGLVRRVWYLEAPSQASHEKILPIPYVHAIVNLGEPYEVVSRGADAVGQSFPAAFVSGLHSTYLVNRNPSHVHHVGAELEPFAWRAFGARPFADEVRDAELCLPALTAVRDVSDATDPETMLLRLEDALASMLTGTSPSPVAVAAARAIAADPSASMAAVASRAGVRPSSLAQSFKTATGTTPKLHAEVHRFHRFLDAIAAPGDLPTWTQLAAGTTYYDQPHFNRAFTRFAGVSPRAYLTQLGEAGRAAPSFVASESA